MTTCNTNLNNMRLEYTFFTRNTHTPQTHGSVNTNCTLIHATESRATQNIRREHAENNDMYDAQRGDTKTTKTEEQSKPETKLITTETTPGNHKRRRRIRQTQRPTDQKDNNHMETKGKARNTEGSNTRTMPPIEKHSEGAMKNDETDDVIVCRRRKHSMLDQVSDDDDFGDERRTVTKSDGIEKDKACRRRKHSMLDHINDDDDFEDQPLLPKGRDRKGHGRQECRSRTHSIPDNHTLYDENQLTQKSAEPHTDTLNEAWLDEDRITKEGDRRRRTNRKSTTLSLTMATTKNNKEQC
jgi:hypothetical protein